MSIALLVGLLLLACAPRKVVVRPLPYRDNGFPSCVEICGHLLKAGETVTCEHSTLVGKLADRYRDPNFPSGEVVVCEIE